MRRTRCRLSFQLSFRTAGITATTSVIVTKLPKGTIPEGHARAIQLTGTHTCRVHTRSSRGQGRRQVVTTREGDDMEVRCDTQEQGIKTGIQSQTSPRDAVQTHKLRTADGCGLTAVSATPVSPPGRSETLKMKKPYTGSTRLRGRGGLSLLMPVLVRPP